MLQPISLKKIRVANPWTEAAALSLLRFGPDDVAEASWIGLKFESIGRRGWLEPRILDLDGPFAGNVRDNIGQHTPALNVTTELDLRVEDAAPSAWTEGRLLSIYWHNRSNALFVFAGSSNGYRYVCLAAGQFRDREIQCRF